MSAKAKVSAVLDVPLYQDPFHPVLLDSPSLHVSSEQDFYIREVLSTVCSDSRFAQKAYLALKFILSGEDPVAAVINSITPSTAEVSTPVTISVIGTGFTSTSVVQSNGFPLTTSYVSATELSAVGTAPATEGVYPVTVDTDGLISNSLDFTATAVVPLFAPTSVKSDSVKSDSVKSDSVKSVGQEKK